MNNTRAAVPPAPEADHGFLVVANKASSAQELLASEEQWGKRTRFALLDDLLGHALVQSLQQRKRLFTLSPRETDRLVVVQWKGLNTKRRAFLEEHFSLASQRTRGAWYVPEMAGVQAGYVNLPFHFGASERFPMTLVDGDRGKAAFNASPEAIFLWSFLGPLFEALFLPFVLRGPDAAAGKLVKSPGDAATVWQSVTALQTVLGLELTDAMTPFLPGRGWEMRRAGEQMQARRRLLDAMAEQVTEETGARWRAYWLREFIGHYHKKSKGGSVPVKRQQAVTKAYQGYLSGCFAGDWLAFLDYLDQQPHPDERIVTALPDTRLYVRGNEAKVARVAAEQGLSVEEVQGILGTLWQRQSISPVEERVKTLQRFWNEFDALHEQQAPGMRPLWGLVAESRLFTLRSVLGDPVPPSEEEDGGYAPYQAGIYRDVLSTGLCDDIDRLWGGTLLPSFPERIVSELFPHATLAEAFGPALTFWQGCALTAWFLCEGPYSRTDMAGLREYHKKHLFALEEMGTPVDPSLFTELIAGERRLGKPQPTRRRETKTTTESGLVITTTLESGMRRSGYEGLRDTITRHRRAWAAQHLLPYLQKRWESELREVSRRYHIHLNEKGKVPTAKQFAKLGEDAANRWFGGDLAALAAALGERSPVAVPERVRQVPRDLTDFAVAVYRALGGTPPPTRPVETEGKAARRLWEVGLHRHRSLVALAELAPTVLQLQEACGTLPTLRQFGASRFTYLAPLLDEDVETAWAIYLSALAAAHASGSAVATKGTSTVAAVGQSCSEDSCAEQNQNETPTIASTRGESSPPAASIVASGPAQRVGNHGEPAPSPRPVPPVKAAPALPMSPRSDGPAVPARSPSEPDPPLPLREPADEARVSSEAREEPRKRTFLERLFRRR